MATAKKKGWKVGDKFRVKTQYGNYVVGEIYTVNGVNGPNLCGSDRNGNNMGQWVQTGIYAVRLKNTKDELKKERADLVTQVAEIDAKLKFLADNDLEEYDEQEFRVYQALTVLDDTTDKMERTRKLAALLKDLS